MAQTKSETIGDFLIFEGLDERGRLIKVVFLRYVPAVQFDVDDLKERRLAAVELVERSLCDYDTAGRICGFHRNTVSKLVRIKTWLGLEALLRDARGPKEPFKYVDGIRSYIRELLSTNPDLPDRAIAERATEDLDLNISRSAVARIRADKQVKQAKPRRPDTNDLLEMAKLAQAIDMEGHDDRQLQLCFEEDLELREKREEFAKEPAPKSERETEQALIDRLQNGERSSFAGGLMHHLFLGEINFNDLLACFPHIPGSTYQSTDILGTLFHSAIHGVKSIEALKLVNATELGLLIGCSRAPSRETLRSHLDHMAKLYLSAQLIEGFARSLLEQVRIDTEAFFIDGHFLPYFGLNVIAKGYYTVRRLAMKGNELYAVTDLLGKPLFFVTESNEIDFRPIISRCASMLKEWGISRPLLIFDRGGYGIHFFSELAKEADFVTWAKYVGEKSLKQVADESFEVGLICNGHSYMVAEQYRTVTESIQTTRRENRTERTSAHLRLVVLKEVHSGIRLGIYTSNTTRPAHDIAYYMLQRWGESENFFKEMMARFNLNYHPGYDIEELEHQPLVDNPDIALIRQALKALRKEVKELEKDIIITQAGLDKRPDKRLVKKLEGQRADFDEKRTHISNFEQKLTTLPDKVSIVDLLKGKKMSRCDLEKKKLYDFTQFMAFHSRETLVNIFRNCYDDHRDVKPVLDMITKKPGYVKLVGRTLVVILDWIENRKHREAAKRFCNLLNERGLKLIGRLNVKLSFHISCVRFAASRKAD